MAAPSPPILNRADADVYHELAGHISLALENIALETVAETPPSLDLICYAAQPASSVEKFVGARQLSGSPVTVIDAGGEFDERAESYINEYEIASVPHKLHTL